MSEPEAFPRRPLVVRGADTSREDGTYIVTRRVSLPSDPGYDEDYAYAVYRHQAGAEPLRYATDEEIAAEVERRGTRDRVSV
jgi:hypothetical protein